MYLNQSMSIPNQFGFRNIEVITSTQNWVVPAGVTAAKVTVVGGGGSGCGPLGTCYTGTAGAGGGYSVKYYNNLTPGTVAIATIGAGGASTSTSGGSGNTGGTSSFSYSSISVTATGGQGGTQSPSSSTVAGGTGTGGNINISGGSSSQITTAGGTPLSPVNGVIATSSAGFAGRSYGGGGYYGSSSSGAGAAGVIIIEY